MDVDGDGQAGGTLRLVFDTLTLTPLPKTAVMGRVFAAEKVTVPGTTNLQNKL